MTRSTLLPVDSDKALELFNMLMFIENDDGTFVRCICEAVPGWQEDDLKGEDFYVNHPPAIEMASMGALSHHSHRITREIAKGILLGP